MSRLHKILILLFVPAFVYAQHEVTIILKEQTEIKHDSIYIVGTFNNWDSLSNAKYLMESVAGDQKSIVLTLNSGTIAYKFHRGSWRTVEKSYTGAEIKDRIIEITGDTMVVDSVQCWRDQIFIDKIIALRNTKNPAKKVPILAAIATNYAFYPEFYNLDSAFHYVQSAIDLHQKIIRESSNADEEQSEQLFKLKEIVASLLHSLGNYSKSLELRLENLALVEAQGSSREVAIAVQNLIQDFISIKDYASVLKYGKEVETLLNELHVEEANNNRLLVRNWNDISVAYFNLGKIDSALLYAIKNEELLRGTDHFVTMAYNDLLLADIYAAKGANETALGYYQKAMNEVPGFAQKTIAEIRIGLAKVYKEQSYIEQALLYARPAMLYFQNNTVEVQSWGENSATYIAELSPLIADLYWSAGKIDSAYSYLQLSVSLKDSLYNMDRIRQLQTLTFNDASRRQQIEQENREAKQQFETKVKLSGLIAGIVGVLFLTFILYRNNKQKQQANNRLQSQKDEIESTLRELRATQAQLIQSEKMASLGELTAGIAHEIQNPLNFVNNFSELNEELMEELKIALKKGNLAEIENIVEDLFQNEEKIKHHGKRAESIVRSMLQHSRASSGVKEPTDINALVDEYLRLAFHGFRAKDKSFNVKYKLDLDPDLPRVDVIPQDIGRVLLNLTNNAFQACVERGRETHKDPANLTVRQTYQPLVSITTRKSDNLITITISDNGCGIASEIQEKIFQPFFTTKPTGEGTGLGLSLSYDILQKHSGNLRVKSQIGIGSDFMVQLPS